MSLFWDDVWALEYVNVVHWYVNGRYHYPRSKYPYMFPRNYPQNVACARACHGQCASASLVTAIGWFDFRMDEWPSRIKSHLVFFTGPLARRNAATRLKFRVQNSFEVFFVVSQQPQKTITSFIHSFNKILLVVGECFMLFLFNLYILLFVCLFVCLC